MEQNPPHQCRTHGEKKVEAETDALLQQLRGICAELEATMRDVSNAQLLGSTAVKAQVSNFTKTIDEHAGPASRREAFTAAVICSILSVSWKSRSPLDAEDGRSVSVPLCFSASKLFVRPAASLL